MQRGRGKQAGVQEEGAGVQGGRGKGAGAQTDLCMVPALLCVLVAHKAPNEALRGLWIFTTW